MFNSLSNFFKGAYNTLKSAVSLGGGQTAAASQAIPQKTYGTAIIDGKSQQVIYDPSIKISKASTIIPQVYPGSAGAGSNQNTNVGQFAPIEPKTISSGKTADTFNPQTALSLLGGYAPSSTISSSDFGGTATSTSSIGSPVTLPQTARGVNPKIDTTAIAGKVAGLYQRNPDGSFTEVKEDKQPTVDDKVKARVDALDKYMGAKPSVYDDPQVEEARKEKTRIQEALRSPMNELNAVISEQTQNLLKLRKVGASEGVTEEVYGNQERSINYDAAIRALPLKASISALQGDLELATDYLTELTQIKSDQINRQYEYKMAQLKSIDGVLDEEERRESAKLQAKYTNDLKREDDLIKMQVELTQKLYDNKDSMSPEALTSRVNRVNAATSLQGAVQAAGQYGVKTGSNISTDNERALMSQFRNEQIVKDYNEILGQKGTIDAYIKNGVGGPADLALVFAFMKGLDPTSVVRETEYSNAAKSGNIFQGVWTKFNGYFKEKGGILPANVRQEFQNLVNQRLAVKQKQYENVKANYEGIAERQKLDPRNVIIDYASGGGSNGETGQSNDDPLKLF